MYSSLMCKCVIYYQMLTLVKINVFLTLEWEQPSLNSKLLIINKKKKGKKCSYKLKKKGKIHM